MKTRVELASWFAAGKSGSPSTLTSARFFSLSRSVDFPRDAQLSPGVYQSTTVSAPPRAHTPSRREKAMWRATRAATGLLVRSGLLAVLTSAAGSSDVRTSGLFAFSSRSRCQPRARHGWPQAHQRGQAQGCRASVGATEVHRDVRSRRGGPCWRWVFACTGPAFPVDRIGHLITFQNSPRAEQRFN
jgi:hypothetical protein